MAHPGGLDWELGADDRERVLRFLDRFARPVVVELGAGGGTIALARGVAERGGTLTSVEHDPAWVARVTEALAQAGLDGSTRVLNAPLEPHPLAEPGVAWYSADALEELPQGIHLLLVDGPPAGEPGSELARAPAIEALESKLATDAIVVLDDVHRAGERAIVTRWEQRTGFRFSAPGNGRIAVGLRPGR